MIYIFRALFCCLEWKFTHQQMELSEMSRELSSPCVCPSDEKRADGAGRQKGADINSSATNDKSDGKKPNPIGAFCIVLCQLFWQLL